MNKEKPRYYRLFTTTTKLLAVFALILIGMPARAYFLPDKGDKPTQSNTVSGHSILLNGLGLAYSYEYAFAPRATILFSAGSSYSFGKLLGLDMNSDNEFSFTTKDYHLITGDLAVEPRFYYNLQKRHRNGKRTLGNSGGYLSLNVGYSFPIAITNGWKAASIFTITPFWGFRRVWRHFQFDLAGGVAYAGSTNGTSSILPTLRLGLGYRF